MSLGWKLGLRILLAISGDRNLIRSVPEVHRSQEQIQSQSSMKAYSLRNSLKGPPFGRIAMPDPTHE